MTTTDYDTPRAAPEQETEQSLEALKARRTDSAAGLGDDADPFETEPDAAGPDLVDEDLDVRVVPRQADEFTCARCFLVHHRSQLAVANPPVCRDCLV